MGGSDNGIGYHQGEFKSKQVPYYNFIFFKKGNVYML